ncbi:MAG: alpha-L-rhamnosidase C-terminal domain-containing protein [Rariglobus sp.]
MKITSAWKRTPSGLIHVALSLPKGVTAEVIFTDEKRLTVTGKNRRAA